MPTDIGEAGMAALATAFRAIGDSSTTWAQTRHPQVTREKVHGAALEAVPIIAIGTYVESYVYDAIAATATRYAVTINVPIRLYFNSQTWNHATDASAWKHDIKKAVRDHFLDDTVFDVTIATIVVGAVDPEDPVCRIGMELVLRWQCSDQDPSVAHP